MFLSDLNRILCDPSDPSYDAAARRLVEKFGRWLHILTDGDPELIQEIWFRVFRRLASGQVAFENLGRFIAWLETIARNTRISCHARAQRHCHSSFNEEYHQNQLRRSSNPIDELTARDHFQTVWCKLTDTRRRVIQALIDTGGNAQAASERLGVCVRNVRNHRQKFLEELQA